ncbi:unnamed protein product [Cunninghamella echinulata]
MADQMNNNNVEPPSQNQYFFSSRESWKQGGRLASQRDWDGIRERSSTGFSTTAAKLDDAWGCHALTETGFTEIGYADTQEKSNNSSSA